MRRTEALPLWGSPRCPDPAGGAAGRGGGPQLSFRARAHRNARHFVHALALGVIGAVCEMCRVGEMQTYREKVFIHIVAQPLFAAEANHLYRTFGAGHLVESRMMFVEAQISVR